MAALLTCDDTVSTCVCVCWCRQCRWLTGCVWSSDLGVLQMCVTSLPTPLVFSSSMTVFKKNPPTGCTHTHRCVASSHFSVPVNRFNRSHAASSRDCLFVPGHTSSCQQNDSDLSTVRRTSYLHSTTVLMSTPWIKLLHLTDGLCSSTVTILKGRSDQTR